ncbi:MULTISPECIES: LysE family translocator [Pseudoalteromonas]|uniref:LysE family translocator n=1 Tax=Pseudoalteromonas obscura TaxID=3048491 RepID=A0ABT7EPJ7_9GAMM|nr:MULTISPECIES: LysE family translocator [Pseudoalteromonas]MBQ4834733.1 LysE family translocator [Pseudoalteromonas luteoviolacea]MDK2596977.1 LysE family translocator [Pseudoalteromonas sp. P94(2023)]
MELSAWLSLALICTLGAMSPGPSLAVVLKHSINSGPSAGISASVAHALGVGSYAALSVLGLASLIAQFPALYTALLYVGAAYLAYLGYMILTSKPSASNGTETRTATKTEWYIAAKEGFTVAFVNPKTAIFFVALFSQFIDPEAMTFTVAFLMCFTVFIIDAIWFIFVSIAASSANDRFNLNSKQGVISKILGAAFILLAARVLYQTL